MKREAKFKEYGIQAITKIGAYLQNTKVFRVTKNNHIRKVVWFLDRTAQKLECLMLKILFFGVWLHF